MDPSVKLGKLANWEEAHVQEKVGKLEEIRKQTNKPPQPRAPVKRMASLEDKENKDS